MTDNQAGDIAPAVPSPDQATPAKRRRGRPAGKIPDKKSETPQQRIDRLKAELLAAEQAKRELEARRDSIVGRAVVAHALADANYRKQLAEMLRREVTSKGDLAMLGELLG